MHRAIYDLQGFAIILDKVALVSRVFDADNQVVAKLRVDLGVFFWGK